MTQAPFHNRESFERVITALIDEAEAKNRGDDLERLVNHVLESPEEVSNLAALVMMIDEDFRARLQQAIEAYRRWLRKKALPADDQAIYEVLFATYKKKRGQS